DPDPRDGDMDLTEIDGALSKIVTDTGIGQFDFFGFDACLMSTLEAYSAIAPYSRYSVGSQELVPGGGWNYEYSLSALIANPMQTPEESRLFRTHVLLAKWQATRLASMSQEPSKQTRTL
ncbi:MAG: hypothetical protein HGA95_02595, partial [Caldiserica bacterium]|nr:hypothetical protein [Caldisericota bacterium]